MSNVQSYNALIDRFKAFASGHFILKSFSHGQIDTADLEKFTEYPFMHVVPSNVTYAKGTKTFSFQIVLADLPRDKDDKVEFQREVLSDLQRIAEDLVAEITNHRVLFGDLITVQNVSLEPFLEEFHNTLTGWTVSLELLVPYYWDACSIPAEWNDMFESGSGGTGSILTFIDSITRDEYGNVSLVNDEATPAPNYYYGTNDEGVRGWYLLTDEVGLTCATIGTCQTIIDIESAIDDLQTEIALKANTADLGAVAFSNDYNDLDNKPTIPDVSGFVPYTGATNDVDLGTYNLTADHIALNVSPSGAGYVVGATQWNNTIGSSETLLKGGSVSLKNGVDLVARVVNKVTPNTTLTKAAYQAVRVSGAQGQRLAIELAQANNDNNSADTIGIVCETIATNQEGFIQTVGQLEGINTTGSLQGETWADGDVLYLSPTTAGALTNIKPTGATGHIVVIGYVEYAHANNGKIYVKVMNGWELDELHNVYINSPANNEVLTYESSTSLWKNKTVATALGYTPVPTTRSITINGTTQDLSADRTFSVGTVTSVAALTLGTTGTDLSSTVANSTSTPVITLNVPTASATNRGALSSADWSTFNGKFTLPSLTSGSVLFSNGTTIAQDNANLFWDDTNNRLGIGTATPNALLDLNSTTQGFLIPRMTTTQRNAISSPSNGLQIFNTTEGYVEYYDAFWGWMPLANQNEWKRKWGSEYFNDFGVNNAFSGDGVFQTFPVNGGGYMSFNPLPTGSNYIGFLGLATGVNTNGQNAIRTDLNTGIFFRPASRISLTSRLWVQTLSDATNRYNIIFGLSQGANSTVANGCVFIYDEGGVGTGTTASPNWQIITAFGSVRTNFVTSVVVSAQTWYSFRIESNSTFTELYYYINDVLVRTETTNIPTSVQNNPIVSITKTVGTTNRAVAVDYLGLKVKLNSAR